MSFIYWQLDWQEFQSDNTWSSTTSSLTDFRDIIVTVKSGTGRDSFNFKIDNFNHDFDATFNNNDKITIYRKINSSSVASSDVLMVGSVKNVPQEESFSTDFIRIEGFNYSETIMGALVFFDPASSVIPVAIQAALNSVNLFNANFAVTWNVGNPSVKQDSSAFPTVTEKQFYKPMRSIIEKYSTAQATEDGTYYWYVDKDNTLVWLPASNAVTTTFTTVTDDYQRLKVSKDTTDVKNYIVMKGGRDPNNRPIQKYVPDYGSIGKHGFKYLLHPSKAVQAESLVDVDKQDNGVDDMKDASYPLTPAWGSSVSSYNDYVAELRVYVQGVLVQEGNQILENTKYGKLKVSFSFIAGTRTWGLGNLVQFTIPQINSIKTINLRVDEIQYTTRVDTYTLVEDIGTL